MSRACDLLILALVTTTVTVLPAQRSRAADATPHASAQFIGNAVAGETLSAFEWAAAKSHPDARVERLAADYIARFVHRPEPMQATVDDPLVATAIEHYREYWRTVLMSDLPAAQAEATLEKRIRRLLTAHGYPQELEGDFATALQAAVEQRGFHALTGRTLPCLELMVWKENEETVYTVELADGPVDVPVTFIGDFDSRGWVNFATLGRASSGGWALPERLVCIKGDQDLDSEDFRVHYLAHEARHFADYRRYPRLGAHDLEYRAKLTELVDSGSTLRPTLSQFIANAREEVASAHSYAEFVLVRNLARALLESESPVVEGVFAGVSDQALKDAAAGLLEDFDRAARRGDPYTLESLILRTSVPSPALPAIPPAP